MISTVKKLCADCQEQFVAFVHPKNPNTAAYCQPCRHARTSNAFKRYDELGKKKPKRSSSGS